VSELKEGRALTPAYVDSLVARISELYEQNQMLSSNLERVQKHLQHAVAENAALRKIADAASAVVNHRTVEGEPARVFTAKFNRLSKAVREWEEGQK
jgi:regulator of replication initiation timing